MKRDNDLLREILLICESDPEPIRWVSDIYADEYGTHYGFSNARRSEHFRLLIEAELVEEVFDTQEGERPPRYGYRITWLGHDYLAAIRSETIWEKTKDGAAQVGAMTLGMMRDLAVAYAKQELKEKLGIDLA